MCGHAQDAQIAVADLEDPHLQGWQVEHLTAFHPRLQPGRGRSPQWPLGCGLIAVTIPVMMTLTIVHGRLPYPVYDIDLAARRSCSWWPRSITAVNMPWPCCSALAGFATTDVPTRTRPAVASPRPGTPQARGVGVGVDPALGGSGSFVDGAGRGSGPVRSTLPAAAVATPKRGGSTRTQPSEGYQIWVVCRCSRNGPGRTLDRQPRRSVWPDQGGRGS